MRYVLKLSILSLLAVAAAHAQGNDDATLKALLSEVRQLRLTLEKSISLAPRMQLLIERAKLQDQKVTRISQQLDEVRKHIAAETGRQTNAAERLAKAELELSSETNADRRKELEDLQAAMKVEAGRGADQQLRAREGELASALQTEQAALDELNGKLDAIERQLEALPGTPR